MAILGILAENTAKAIKQGETMIIFTIIYTLIKKKELKRFPIWCRLVNRLLLDKYNNGQHYTFGFRLYCGKQGSGKTYSAVKKALEFEGANLITNLYLNVPFDYHHINIVDEISYCLDDTKQNIILLDEIQTLLDSRNFNADFYRLFCQLRKRNVLILGTGQVFERVAKPLREQVNKLYFCRTYGGALTVCNEIAVLLNSNFELPSQLTSLGSSYTVQSDFVRNAYNTSQII